MLFGTRRWSARLLCNDLELERQAVALLGWVGRDIADLPPPSSTFELIREPEGVALQRNGEQWSTWSDTDSVLADLHWCLIHEAFRSPSGTLAFHAGLIEFDGVRILIPGDSEHGKSTLVLAACLEGARFGGDDLTWMELDSLSVLPFPLALALSTSGLERFGHGRLDQAFLKAEVERAEVTDHRCFLHPEVFSNGPVLEGRLSAIAIRQIGRWKEPELKRLAPAEGLRRLYPYIQFRWEERTEVFGAMGELVEKTPVYEVTGEAEHIAVLLRERLGGSS